MSRDPPPEKPTDDQDVRTTLQDYTEVPASNRTSEETDPTPSQSSDSEETAASASTRTKELLNSRQLVLYNQDLRAFRKWMCTAGKEPRNRIGLSERTVENYVKRFDQLFRYTWTDIQGPSELRLTHSDADELCKALKTDSFCRGDGQPYSPTSKRKFNDTLTKYFEWRAQERSGREWKPPYDFEETAHQPPDYFTRAERRKLRETILEYDSLPSYSDCSPEQRSRLKAHLAQKLGKPKADITPADWNQHNQSWEKVSLIWTALDAGLRPIEVSRAIESWARPEKAALYIPKEQSSKNRNNWEIALRTQTADILSRWLDERSQLPKYDESEHLWLTRESNPWSSSSLNYLLKKLCDEAGIDLSNRNIVWYSSRHSVGQHLSDEGGLEQAKAQLRHESIESTLKYANPSLEKRRDSLDGMG